MDIISWEKYIMTNMVTILSSLILALIGLIFARYLRTKLIKIFSKTKKNQAVKLFITNTIYMLVLVISGIMVLGKLGVPTASLITIVGTSSLAIGLAMKDFLSNIAAGMMLVFQRPFEIGDLVECSGTLGVVHNIDLFNVKIKTPSNEIVVIPNGKLAKEKITNKAFKGIRRLEITIAVSYESSIDNAKELLGSLLQKEQRALTEPAPIIGVSNLLDSGVELSMRVWVKRDDYIPLRYYLLENILVIFKENNISIPFNQLDISLKSPNIFSQIK